jgi:plastocyanin
MLYRVRLARVVRTVAALLVGSPAFAVAGAIHGTVTLQGPPPDVRRMPVTIDQYVCGQEKEPEDLVVSARSGIRHVVAWLENPPSVRRTASRPTAATVEMDQKGCVFTPRVLLVPAGGTVNFLNSDRLLHNLHGRPTANPPFNRAQPKGRTIPLAFAHPEIIRIDCDLHSWMRAWVVVTEHPFYAVTNADGDFRFGDVPPGRYTLRLWHETLGTTTRDVVVPDGGPARVTVEMSRK